MRKINLNLGLVALFTGFGLVATQSAFTIKRSQTWTFNQSVSTDMQNYHNYTLNGTPSAECTSIADYPCQLSVDVSIDTPAELKTFLSGKTNSQILSFAIGRVPEL